MNFPFIKKKKPVAESIVKDKDLKRFMVKAVGLITKQGAYREDFSFPEYDLEEIKIASASDSYIKQALMKYTYLIYKAGYSIKSENEAASEYIKKRFRIMSFATGKAMDLTMQEIADDLAKYSNAFLIKSRVDTVMPGVKAKGVLNGKPVGGYFRVDPASIRVKPDENGKVLKYRQIVDGKEKLFNPSEVVHFYLDREAGHHFGTPRISAALEDVKLLRKIEGNVISLIYRFAIPIYQWIVGIPEQGFQATDKEIDEARREIEKVSLDGMFVTNERTQIKAIGAEGHALDATSYLQYFEKRVFTALGVSESQMGRGGSKQDADSMEAQAHDTVKYIQRTLSIFIENYIINELLLEGGFDPIFNEQDIVRYEFHETSLDTKVKIENHEMLKFQSNVATLEETRRSLGKKEQVMEDRLYFKMVDQGNAVRQIKEQTKSAIEIQKNAMASQPAESPSSGAKGNGKLVGATKNKDVETRNRPQNQHGTTSAKIKESKDYSMKMRKGTKLDASTHKKTYESLYKRYKQLGNDIGRTPQEMDVVIPVAKDALLTEIRNIFSISAQAGMADAKKELKTDLEPFSSEKLSMTFLEEYAEGKLKNLLKDLKGHIDNGRAVEDSFNALEYRLRFLVEYVEPKAYWYAFVKSCGDLGVEKLYVDFNGSHDKKDHPSSINPKSFDWEEIPPYHAFCSCSVSTKAGEKK